MDAIQPTEHSGHFRQPLDEVNPNEGSLLQQLTQMSINKNHFVTQAPTEPFRLTYIDVMSLVINRMIGTGIFDTPKTVMLGIGILFWFCGCVYTLAGDLSEGTICGIAIIIAIFPCLIHAFSRRGAIRLNNLHVFIKVFMLSFMIIATWAVRGERASGRRRKLD
ncbi:hypothetical protein ACLX1H_003369 [Fusarium chlamydosporum]